MIFFLIFVKNIMFCIFLNMIYKSTQRNMNMLINLHFFLIQAGYEDAIFLDTCRDEYPPQSAKSLQKNCDVKLVYYFVKRKAQHSYCILCVHKWCCHIKKEYEQG